MDRLGGRARHAGPYARPHLPQPLGGKSDPVGVTALGDADAFVIAHTDCGMLTFTNEELRQTLADEAGADASGIDFLPFPDPDERVRESVRRIRESPLLPDSFTAAGFVYDVRSGGLREVA